MAFFFLGVGLGVTAAPAMPPTAALVAALRVDLTLGLEVPLFALCFLK